MYQNSVSSSEAAAPQYGTSMSTTKEAITFVSEEQVRPVVYNGRSHTSILFKTHGSVWPKVLPYCLVNMTVMGVTEYLYHQGVNLYFSQKGHSFMSVIVGFLVVSRVNVIVSRYMDMKANLNNLFTTATILLSNTAAVAQDQTEEGAVQWRHDVCYRTMIFIQSAVAFMRFRSTEQNVWDMPGLEEDERRYMMDNIYQPGSPAARFAHGGTQRLLAENARVATRMSGRLLSTIVENRNKLNTALAVPTENKLLGYADHLYTAYTK